jgi:protein-L-isoaspartate(D-aspartate) O-methyltransferase
MTTDYAEQRRNMVDSQLRPNGVTDPRILAAMGSVAREDFVPEARRAVAYRDGGHEPMAPMVFGKLLQLAGIGENDRVLLIGSAYGAAVLQGVARSLVAVEGLAAVKGGPFDVIVIEGKVNLLPESFVNHVRDGGRVVAILQENGVANACVWTFNGKHRSRRAAFAADAAQMAGFEAKAPEFAF